MATDTPKLDTPHMRVTVTDGTQYAVQTTNADMVMYDLERAKRRWPSLTDAPFLWLSYLAFSALRRDGTISASEHFDSWVQTTVEVKNLNETGQESDETVKAFPTLLAAGQD